MEICLGGRWGTVCDDQWDSTDASVVCKQLGYSSNGNITIINTLSCWEKKNSTMYYLIIGAVATGTASFGRGDGPIFMDDTRCTGNETQLILCPSSGIGSHNCLHFEDAGAICQRKQLPVASYKISSKYTLIFQHFFFFQLYLVQRILLVSVEV